MFGLACLTGTVFFPVLGFEFVDFDTYDQVLINDHIRGLNFENLKHIFTSRCITSYYPVRTLTYAIDYHIWGGIKDGGFKLTNVLIHLANCLLVFWLVLRLRVDPMAVDRASGPRWDLGVASLAGGIFAIHPVVVEPVVWVPGREELLMTLGALGTIHFHINARRRSDADGSRAAVLANHAGAVFCCAIACLSNAVGAIIPMLVVAWDVLMLHRRKWRRMVLGTAPLWVIAVATVITKVFYDTSIETVDLIQMTWGGRLMIGLNAYWLNLKMLIWPDALCLYYDWLYPTGFLDVNVLLGMAAVALTLGVLWSFRRRRLVLFGLFWFGLGLAPTLQIVSHHIHRADRFLYLPLAGLATAIALALRPLAGRIKGWKAAGVAVAVGSAIVVSLATHSARHLPVWRTSLSTWEQCLVVDRDNARAHDVVGDHFARLGESEKAIEHYETALRLRPFAVETLENYGYHLATWEPELRDYMRAISLVKRAHTIMGGRSESIRATLAEVYASYAHHLQQDGEYARAVQQYERSLTVDKRYALSAYNLALLRATCPDQKLRRPEEAVRLAEWAQSVELHPNANGQLILATAYAQSGRYGAAAIATARALDLARMSGDAKLVADLQRQLAAYEKLAGPAAGP